MARPTFSADQLKIGGNHLLHEVQMFSNTAALLDGEGDWEWGWKDKTTYMAVLESFLLHARGLMYFLCPPTGYEKNPVKKRELFAEDFSVVAGRHQIVFGAEYIRRRLDFQVSTQQNPEFDFNGQFTNDPLSDLLLGRNNQFIQGNLTKVDELANYFALYAHDKVRLSPRLSLNADHSGFTLINHC